MKTGTYTLLTVLLVLFTGVSHLNAQSKKIDGIKYKVIAPGKVKVEEGKDMQGTLQIPATVTIGKDTYQVTNIGESAFENCTALQSVVLPEGLEQIEKWAFRNCNHLLSVTFPLQIKEIKGGAFQKCISLESIELNNIQSIENYAFNNCISLKNVTLNNVKKVYYSAFEGCSSLENSILKNVEYIYDSAFENCYKLTATINGTKYIGENAFKGCLKIIYHLPNLEILPDHPEMEKGKEMDYSTKSKLEKGGFFLANTAFQFCNDIEINFPTTVKRIGNNIFSYMAEEGSLKITLPESLNEIGDNAFKQSGLTSITLPSNVSINENAFAKCNKLRTINAITQNTNQTSVRTKFGAFQYCNALESVQLPANVTELGPNTFAYCSSLRSVQAPGVQKIGSGAFKECRKLSQIRFSSSLKDIGNDAFRACNALKSLQGINEKTYLGANAFFGAGITPEQLKKSFTYQYYTKVYQSLLNWRKKGEFETTDQWRARVTPEAQKAKTEQLIKEAEEAYLAPYRNAEVTGLLGTYNADQGLYSVTLNANGEIMDKQYIAVPLADAPAVKSSWNQAVITPVWDVYNDMPHASSFTVEVNGKTYQSRSDAPLLASSNLTLDMPLPEIDFGTDTPPANVNNRTTVAAAQPAAPARDNRLDTDIPVTGKSSPNTFAVIIGNENYQHVSHVPHALNDAKVFAAYCQKTLGLPQPNIRSYRDATFGTMLTALADLKSIADAYEGNIQVLFYYAGHGIPNETGSSAYLLPVDANGTQTEACLSLDRLYQELGALKARSVIVFMDACFSGAQRGDGMLVSARGIVVKAKAGRPTGNTVVFSAAQGDETAFPYNEKGHGLFTYYLLEKIRETRGDITLGELTEYVETQVKRQSVVINRKSQTPTVTPSLQIGSEAWKSLRLQ